jgi:hypothetical protein
MMHTVKGVTKERDNENQSKAQVHTSRRENISDS